MDTDPTRPVSRASCARPLEATLRRIERGLTRTAAGLTVLLVPVAMARLPHYLEAGLFVLGVHALVLIYVGLVRVGQRAGLIGAGASDVSTGSAAVDDPFAAPSAPCPPALVAPIAATPALERQRADAEAPIHTLVVPGRGQVSYRIEALR